MDDHGFWQAETKRRRRRTARLMIGIALGAGAVAAAVTYWRHAERVHTATVFEAERAPLSAMTSADAKAEPRPVEEVSVAPATPPEDAAPDPAPVAEKGRAEEGTKAVHKGLLATLGAKGGDASRVFGPADKGEVAIDPFTGKKGRRVVARAKRAATADLADVFSAGDEASGAIGALGSAEVGVSMGFGGMVTTGRGVGSAGGAGSIVRHAGGVGVARATGRAHGAGYGKAAAPEAKAPTVSRGVAAVASGSSGEVSKRGASYAALVVPKKKASSAKRAAKKARLARAKAAARRPVQVPLKAGSTDDNQAFKKYLEFLSQWSDQAKTAGYVHVDVRDRRFVQVVDAGGRPVAGAELTVRNGQTTLWRGRTYGDGRAALYARSTFGAEGACRDAKGEGEDCGLLLEVRHQGQAITQPLGGGRLKIELPLAATRRAKVPLDVVFLIDTTSSMADEIARIKATLLSVTERVRKRRGQGQDVDLRYGGVLYRDRSDAYITRKMAFTRDVEAFDQQLDAIRANGGGDYPESLNAGLAAAVDGMKWRKGAAKLVFLVADAPPHMDYGEQNHYAASAKAALSKGIRVHAVAASGLDPLGTLVFRQVAQLTRGRFIFIQYGSAGASAAKHGVQSQVETNNLDTIIYERITWEIDHWERPH